MNKNNTMARVLIVDDEETILQSLEILLDTEGHEIAKFRDSQKAAEAIRAEKFDLMVTDIRMTPLDGVDLMKLAKQLQPQMGLVVVTAYVSEKTMQQSFDLGCVAYIKKPFKMQEVLDAVNLALGKV